ncbi:MAG: class I SAM-dependent RNA methyltransferase, partial [Aquificae bacterium]|nr:class I SAM-dependent RNA methyltransferase [Aquificota bacterium]
MVRTFEVQRPLYSPYFEARPPGGSKEVAKLPRTAPGEVWKGEHLKEGVYKPVEPLRLNLAARRVPPCGYYPLCSGCQWQHLRPERQTEFKVELFKRFVGVYPDEVLVSPSEFGYRVSTFLYGRGSKLGFKKAWFYDERQPIMDLDHCRLLHLGLNEGLRVLKGVKFPAGLHAAGLLVNPQTGELFLKLHFLKKKFPEGHRIENLAKKLLPAFAGIGVYAGEYLHWERVKVYGRWESAVVVGGFKLFLSPDAFVQPNYLLWEGFLRLVRPLEEHERGVELHAGIGFFTFNLSRFVKTLESSELNPIATALRERAKAANGVKNLKNVTADALKHLKKVDGLDLLVVDPPRGGLGKPLVEEILKKRPKEIIYVSCNLSSLERDLKLLREAYEVVRTAMVDQFPNTY